MRSNLWDDPRIARICDLTNKREAEVIGGLYWLWTMADEQTADGHLDGLSLAAIDRKTGIKNLGASLVKVGWILESEEGVEIARFEEHNGASAKRRAVMAKASSKYRSTSSDRHQSCMTDASRSDDLDKNRIDITPIVPKGDEQPGLILEVETSPKPETIHPHLLRLRALFQIRESTLVDPKTQEAWEKNKKSAADLNDSEWKLLEWAYRQKEGPAATFRRKDLPTLLRNLPAEISRARGWLAETGYTTATTLAFVEPEGWRDLIEAEYPEVNLSTWANLPESMKTWVRNKIKKSAAA